MKNIVPGQRKFIIGDECLIDGIQRTKFGNFEYTGELDKDGNACG